MARFKTYQYQQTDNPLTLAQSNGITPQELIDANPGGYPFTTGQTVNIPNMWQGVTPGYNYQVGAGNIAKQKIQQAFLQNPGNPLLAVGAIASAFNPVTQMQRGIEENRAGNVPKQYQLYTNTAKEIANRQPETPSTQQPTYTGENDSSFNMQLKNEQNDIRNALANKTPPDRISVYSASSLGINPAEHGYQIQGSEWVYTGGQGGGNQGANSEFMNTNFMQQNVANNTPFLNQLRWDGKKYVTIGSLLKSGQLDLQGNVIQKKNSSGGNLRRRQTRMGLVNFGASSG